jgi:acyl carrier protein
MKMSDFCAKLADLFDIDATLTPQTNLKDFDEYDSMAIMTLVAFLHKSFGKQFTARQLNQVTTIDSLIEIIGRENFSE